MSGGQKVYSKMHPVSSTNTNPDVIDLVNNEIVKNRKAWIPYWMERASMFERAPPSN